MTFCFTVEGDSGKTQHADGLADTGAGLSLADADWVDQLPDGAILSTRPPQRRALTACAANGEGLDVLYEAQISIRVGRRLVPTWLHVANHLAVRTIFGNDTLFAWDARIRIRDHIVRKFNQ